MKKPNCDPAAGVCVPCPNEPAYKPYPCCLFSNRPTNTLKGERVRRLRPWASPRHPPLVNRRVVPQPQVPPRDGWRPRGPPTGLWSSICRGAFLHANEAVHRSTSSDGPTPTWATRACRAAGSSRTAGRTAWASRTAPQRVSRTRSHGPCGGHQTPRRLPRLSPCHLRIGSCKRSRTRRRAAFAPTCTRRSRGARAPAWRSALARISSSSAPTRTRPYLWGWAPRWHSAS